MDIENDHIVVSKITTKNQGSYTLKMQYNAAEILPYHMEVSFAVENLKIPLNFMGSDTSIDRKAMKSNKTNTGTVKLQIKNYDIKKLLE